MVQWYPFRRVKGENFIQKIFKLTNFSHLLFREILIGYEFLLQIATWLNDTHNNDFILPKISHKITRNCWIDLTTYPFCDFIDFMWQEITVRIKMIVFELPFANDFVGKFSFKVHETLQHLIVGFSIEKYSAGVYWN